MARFDDIKEDIGKGDFGLKQVVQSYRTGKMAIEEMPAPAPAETGVLMRNVRSAISAGTERMIIDIAKKSLIGKATARPDLVRQVLNKVKTEGLMNTFQKVKGKLDTPIPLGYSCAGEVVESGAFVDRFRPGDRIACGGAGYANHAEFNHVPRNLCARIPDGVGFEEASFTTIGAIALQGVRQADLRLGERVVVLGLGLIGQITAQIVRASGCRVLGTDVVKQRLDLAAGLGVDEVVLASETVRAAEAFTSGAGADAVIITAADHTSELIRVAGEISKLKGRVVVVGLVGMDVPRDLYYRKELVLRLSMSYGPGRYDPIYEEGGIDYPFSFVRWTEGRNMEAFLELVARGNVKLGPIISHRFPFEKILDAYDMILNNTEPYMGVVVEYRTEGREAARERIVLSTEPAKTDSLGVGLIGAGNFAQGVLLPNATKIPGVQLLGVADQVAINAKNTASRFGAKYATADYRAIIADPAIRAVMVVTRHDSHARISSEALEAGKAVFVEKPLAISPEALDELEATVKRVKERGGSPVILAGFNRRHSKYVRRIREIFAKRSNPLMLQYRVNAGFIPANSWIQSPTEGGGRIIGEGCHFVDTLRFIVGHPITQVYAEAISPSTADVTSDDNTAITLRFADGSVGQILYLALGDTSLSKERLEVSGERKSVVLDDYRELIVHAGGRSKKELSGTQDKGHAAEIAAFMDAALGKRSVDFGEMAEVTRATFKIMESMRKGAPIPMN